MVGNELISGETQDEGTRLSNHCKYIPGQCGYRPIIHFTRRRLPGGGVGNFKGSPAVVSPSSWTQMKRIAQPESSLEKGAGVDGRGDRSYIMLYFIFSIAAFH